MHDYKLPEDREKLIIGGVGAIIKMFGMKNTLEAVIANCDAEEDYIVKLREDLQTALTNYNYRYDWRG